jgi:hypothetical protein
MAEYIDRKDAILLIEKNRHDVVKTSKQLHQNDMADAIVKDLYHNIPTANVIPIPEGATNGDMIKVMLNPYKICEYKYSVHVYMTEKDFLNGNYQMNLDSDWWYAAYKEVENGKNTKVDN